MVEQSDAATTIVVPCYNEAERLPSERFVEFAGNTPWLSFVFVNDGSEDATLDVLSDLTRRIGRQGRLLDRQPNQGKAAAVRAGMLAAFGDGATYAGYWDADLATPLEEIPRFRRILRDRPAVEIVLGSRVKLLGHDVERRPARHYLGRAFATAASTVLDLPVYDTQCGAKLFRNSETVRALFEEPFCTGWIFDVEILARLTQLRRAADAGNVADVLCELPLTRWHDVAGSRVRPTDFLKALGELARIRRRYLTS